MLYRVQDNEIRVRNVGDIRAPDLIGTGNLDIPEQIGIYLVFL